MNTPTFLPQSLSRNPPRRLADWEAKKDRCTNKVHYAMMLTPCVWYSNQPGVDGIQGIDFLLSPGCFLATAIAVIGWLLRKEAICLIGNLLFIPAMLLFVYRQGQIFEGNSYSAMTLMSGLSAWGIAVIGIAVAGCIISVARMVKKAS